MASKGKKRCGYSDNDTLFVGRFVYDVIAFTLKKCGYPEESVPPTNCKENVYNRADFVKVASASALRVALIMRDKWKQMFISRSNISEFSDREIRTFLGQLVLCCPLYRTRRMQSTVEVFLASLNEIILFFHSEGIDFDLNMVIKYISTYIVFIIGPHVSISKRIEDLFDEFDNISGYTRWITNFVKKYAVPYGSRDDVSDLFFERVKKQFRDEMKRTGCPGTPSIRKLNIALGFLPNDRFATIVSEESCPFLKSLSSVSKAAFPENSGLAMSPESPVCSESDAIKGRQSGEKNSTVLTDDSEEIAQKRYSSKSSSELEIENNSGQISLSTETTAQRGHNSKNSLELGIEDNLGQISLSTEEIAQRENSLDLGIEDEGRINKHESHGAIPKQTMAPKKT